MTLSNSNTSRPAHHIIVSMRTLFGKLPLALLTISLGANLLLVYLLLFLSATNFETFFISNTSLYIAAAMALTAMIALLGGIALAQAIYIAHTRQALWRAQGTARGLFGAGIGALSVGCPACASLLLPALGIAGSLAIFPLGGLEIKLLSLIILVDAIWEGSRIIAGVCPPMQSRLFSTDDENRLVINVNRQTLRQLKPVALIAAAVLAVYLLPMVPAQYRASFARPSAPAVYDEPSDSGAAADGQGGEAPGSTGSAETIETAVESGRGAAVLETSALLEQINPSEGYTLPYTYGDIGPQILEAGGIDLERFVQLYEDSGRPLTDAQMQILTEGSDEPITINRENAHFVLNFLWAFGLTNQNPVLDEGPMMQYGDAQVVRFASTGGWSLAAIPIDDLYSSAAIIELTPEQQAIVEEAAENTYRPCCNNSTAFADCNHGMAMLGLFELMASQGATIDELFEAAKHFNAFWFPQQTLDLAIYFGATTGESFDQVDPRTLVGADYSSAGGWRSARQWLAENDLIEEVPGGSGCGV